MSLFSDQRDGKLLVERGRQAGLDWALIGRHTDMSKLGCLLLRSSPGLSTPPSPPDCFYFLRISISSFIYLFVINLNDPGWRRDSRRGPRLTSSAWSQLPRGLRGEGQPRRPMRGRCLEGAGPVERGAPAEAAVTRCLAG